MAKKTTTLFGYLFSLLVGGTLLYLVFRNISFEDFIAKAKHAEYTWVYLSMGIALLSYFIRAFRWTILMQPLGFRVPLLRATNALSIAYLANLVLPRLGEVTRCGMLKKSDDVPISLSLGTVIAERIIDTLSLGCILLITLLLEFDKLSRFLAQFGTMVDSSKIFSMAIGGCLTLLLIGTLGYLVYNRMHSRLQIVIKQLLEGVLALKDISNIPGFILSTLLLWTCYYFMGYLVLFAIPETSGLGWEVGLMLIVSAGIAVIIPVQGGFGTYHTITSAMLLLYSIEKTTGVFIVTLNHSAQVVATVVYGIISIIISMFIPFRSASTHDTPRSEQG